MVKIVITPEFFGVNENPRDIKRQLNKWGANDIEFGEDGIISAVMTELNFEKFMAELKEKTDNYLTNIIDEYENIKLITHDNFYINFNVIGKDIDYDTMPQIANEIRLSVAAYQIFNGIPQLETSVIVYFRNTPKGKPTRIIDTSVM